MITPLLETLIHGKYTKKQILEHLCDKHLSIGPFLIKTYQELSYMYETHAEELSEKTAQALTLYGKKAFWYGVRI